jgi:hypothetical protein
VNPIRTEHGDVALRFAEALRSGRFDLAHSYLSPPLAMQASASDLKTSYEQMIAYGGAPATDVELMTTLEDWPDKRPNDIGWAYVSIAGPGYSEAGTVVVTDDGQIRDVEWGRP